MNTRPLTSTTLLAKFLQSCPPYSKHNILVLFQRLKEESTGNERVVAVIGDTIPCSVTREMPLPERECLGSFPAAHEGGAQAEHQRCAVEQHVEPVRDQPQTVGPDAVQQFHCCEHLKNRQIGIDLRFPAVKPHQFCIRAFIICHEHQPS